MTRQNKPQESAAPVIRSTAQEDEAMHREMAARAASIPGLGTMAKVTRDMSREEIVDKIMSMGKPRI